MDNLWWDVCVMVFGFLGDTLQLVLLLWLAWREVGRILEEKINEAIEQVTTEKAVNNVG